MAKMPTEAEIVDMFHENFKKSRSIAEVVRAELPDQRVAPLYGTSIGISVRFGENTLWATIDNDTADTFYLRTHRKGDLAFHDIASSVPRKRLIEAIRERTVGVRR